MSVSPTDPRSVLRRNLDVVALAAICFVCFFWQLGQVELHDFNEGLYVGAAREMYLRGEWATPRLNGEWFFDKPPLALWCSAICFSVLGINELAARLPVAVATAALVALTYLLGLRWFGRRAGFYAACALALSPLVLGTARQMTMDLHQSLWFAVAMACFYFGYMSEGPRGKRWYHGMWAACGLGYLSKSVPGLFPLFLAFVFVCVEARGRPREIGRRIAEARVPVGLLLMLAITVPWHVLAYRSAGFVFYQEYFLHHHVDLLTGKDFSHGRPASYYLPSLLWGMFPWSLFLPMALVRAWRGTAAQPGDGPGDAPAAGPEADQARRFVLVWAAGLVLMFTAMSSKLHSYLLPMYPAAALLVGDWLAGAVSAKRWRALALASGLAALAVTAASVVATVAIGRLAGTPREAELHETISDLALHRAMASAYLLAAGLMLGAVLIAAARRRAGVVTMIGTLTVFTGLLVAWMLPALNATINVPLHEVAREAGRYAAAGMPVAVHIAGPVRPSMFFYMPAELARREPDPVTGQVLLVRGEQPPIKEFLEAHRPAYVFTDAKRARALLESTPALSPEMQRGRWVLLRAAPIQRVAER